jgi:hypothetical protein
MSAITNCCSRGQAKPTILSDDNLLAVWQKTGLDKEVFLADRSTAEMILKLHLHHPLHIWANILRLNRASYTVEVLVEGQWQKASSFFKELQPCDDQWQTKDNPNEMWTCTGFGFCKRKDAGWTHLPTYAKLSAAELAFTRHMAQKLPSPYAKLDQDCVLEIVGGWKERPKHWLLSGFFKYIRSPQHPFIRLIDQNGNVKGCGFCPSRPIAWYNLFSSCAARFPAPDPFEGVGLTKKYVTRIAISKAQRNDLEALLELTKQEGRSFNYITRNCTAFVSAVLNRVGFSPDAYISTPTALFRILPIPVQKIFSPLAKLAKKIEALFQKVFQSKQKQGVEDPTFFREGYGKWLHYPLPQKLNDWQLAQPSTTIYPKGKTFYEQHRAL